MIYKELRSKQEISKALINNCHVSDETMLPPMFHGTDASLINISKAKRDQLNNICNTIITTLFEEYKKNSISLTDKRLIDSSDHYGSSANAYLIAEARINKNPLYNYGDFYVTNNPRRAISYSQEAWIYGETGWIANRLIEGAKALELKLPDTKSFMEAFELFEIRRQKEKNPVIIVRVKRNQPQRAHILQPLKVHRKQPIP